MKVLTCSELETSRRDLMLVNRSHPLPDSTVPELAAPDPAYPEILMERRASLLLSACIRAAGGEGQIIPVSGWRSHAEQQAIWDDTMKKEGPAFTRSYVAYPGCSEHETGLAIDLALAAPEIDFIRPNFPYDGVCGSFRRLAPRYGFVERYRADKQAVTGIAAEPWHFRYVGVPHALLMEHYGVCLEEYLDLLCRQELTCTLENGRKVYVSRTDDHTTGQFPSDGCVRQAFFDNAGGFILTRWEGIV